MIGRSTRRGGNAAPTIAAETAALHNARRAKKARRVRFQAGSSTPLHLIGVELEKVGDDFGFGRVGRVHFIQHDIAEL